MVCLGALGAIIGLDYFLAGVQFYWAALFFELAAAYYLVVTANHQRSLEDRMYYRALSAFMWLSCIVTGLYIYDIGPYESFALYGATSRAIGIIHAIFMLVFTDGITDSKLFVKMLSWFSDNHSRHNTHS